MTLKTTEELIKSLTRDLAPVRPLRPPAVRAAGCLGIVLLALVPLVLFKGHPQLFAERLADPRMALQCAATLLTGVAAVVAAFYLSVPDRSSRFRYVSLLPFALWVASSGAGCLQYGLGLGPAGHRLGQNSHCFVFIISTSIPLAAFLYAVLRRARPLETVPVLLTTALGVAALAAFTLQFFHTFDTTWVDLAVHLIAVGTVIGLATASRRLLESN